MKLSLKLIILVLLLNFTSSFSQKIQIANEFAVNISSNQDYISGNTGLVYEKEFRSEGSGYVKVHFTNFDLSPGDYVKVRSLNSSDEYIYSNQGKIINTQNQMINNFWSTTLWSDSIIVELYSAQGNSSHYGFDIDTVAYGHSMDKINQAFQSIDSNFETVCSADDREAIVCYDGTEIGRKSEAVCRLLIGGGGLCTGWLLGCDGNVMTNNHCIGSTAEAQNTEFLFNFQFDDCLETMNATSDLVATSSILIQTDGSLDFTLVMLPVNPVPTYGFLSLSSAIPVLNERIYIPQHPGGRRKEIAVNTDVDGDANGFAKIIDIGGLPNRVEYQADTEGGSSGSPVIRYSDHLVVAIHNTGGCPNGSFGRSDELIAAIGTNMPNCGVDDPNPESPSISFNSSNAIVNENTDCSFQDIDFTLRIALPASNNADVTITPQAGSTTTIGVDFELLTPTLSFSAGDTTDKVGTIRIYNDAFIEGEESLTLDLSLNANGGDANIGNQGAFTVTILDDDFDPSVGNQINLASDDFESTLANWTITGNGTPTFALGDEAAAASGAWNANGNATNFVFINDDACNCTMDNERLMYNLPIDLSNVSNASLSFDLIHRDSNDQFASDSYAQVSTDNGVTWQNVGDEFITYTTWTNLTIDLSAYAGQSNVMISFLYNDLGNWAYGLAIDNFSVDGNGNAFIQTNVNDGISSATLPLASTGLVYAYDSLDGSIMAHIENNDNFDYDCVDVSVSRAGTSGQPHQGSTGALLAMDKQFDITPSQNTQTGNAAVTFYLTEDEVAGWETAVSNAGGSHTRTDLHISRTPAIGDEEVIVATIGSYDGHVTLTGNFTGIDGVFTFAPQEVLLSVSEFDTDAFSIYPNPVSDVLTIQTKNTLDTISIYDINGRQINSTKLNSNQLTNQINVSTLSQGLYFIEIKSNNSKQVQKFIKK